MFDIGFAELILVAIVGLLVIGPEQLPSTVRTVALWVGRIKRSFNNMKQDIEREVGADDIRRELHNEQVLNEIERSKQAIEDVKSGFENDISGALSGLDNNESNKELSDNLEAADSTQQKTTHD